MNSKSIVRILLASFALPIIAGAFVAGCGPSAQEQENLDRMTKGVEQSRKAMPQGGVPSNIPGGTTGK